MAKCQVLVLVVLCVTASWGLRCLKPAPPLELGEWHLGLQRLDSSVVTARPVSAPEGFLQTYENHFPDKQIKYISVENKARRSCGARATLAAGGLDRDHLVVHLRAKPNQEIRSVVDVWGKQSPASIRKSKVGLREIAEKVRI